jgi:hypothetical protein
MLTNAQFYSDSHLGRPFGITDAFSGHHSGQDVNGWAAGTRIPSFGAGEVVRRGTQPLNLGNWVTVKIGAGDYIHYCHLRELTSAPKVGTMVRVGDDVGPLGNTGYSFGAHLHAMRTNNPNPEIYSGLKDPLPLIRASRTGGGGGGGITPQIESENEMSTIISLSRDGKPTAMRLAEGGLTVQETTDPAVVNAWRIDASWPGDRELRTGDAARRILEWWVRTIAANEAKHEAIVARVVGGALNVEVIVPPVTDEQLDASLARVLQGIDFPDAAEIADAVNDDAAARLAE